MNEPRSNELRDALWKGTWSASQEAELAHYLEAHPEARKEWEADLALQRTLDQLAPVPVSSNFTDRVMRAVDIELGRQDAKARRGSSWWRIPFLGRALAGAAALVAAGGLLVHQHRVNVRSEIAHSIAVATDAARLPGVDALENFDAISRLDSITPVDEELFGALTELASNSK